MVLLLIIIAVGVCIYFYVKKDNEKVEDYKDLYQYSGMQCVYGSEVPDASTLKKVFSDKDLKAKAEAHRNKDIEWKKQYQANEHKEFVIKRTYSYKYEDFIYGLFAPYRVEKGFWTNKNERWNVHESLEIEFVKDEISRVFNLDKENASKLFKVFVDNWLLSAPRGKKKCSLGGIFHTYWNIISEYDNNFSSWVESHNDIESKESSKERRAPYDITKAVSLSEFEKTNRICRLDQDWSDYILVCDYANVHVYLKHIGYHGEENKSSIEKYIRENKDNLIVFEDDNWYDLLDRENFNKRK